MSRNGSATLVRGNKEAIISAAEKRVAEKSEPAHWLKVWNDKMDGERIECNDAIFHRSCGQWKSRWDSFVIRKIKFLDEQIKERIAEYGNDDWMVKASRERRESFVQFAVTTNQIAKGMSAIAEEMFLHGRLLEATNPSKNMLTI